MQKKIWQIFLQLGNGMILTYGSFTKYVMVVMVFQKLELDSSHHGFQACNCFVEHCDNRLQGTSFRSRSSYHRGHDVQLTRRMVCIIVALQ